MLNKVKLSNKKKTVLIAGHMDTSKSEFDKYYKNQINELMNTHDFILGAADGLDTLALKYLLRKHNNKYQITVCIPNDEEKDFKKKYKNHLKKINLISHFDNIKADKKPKEEKAKKLVSKFKMRDIFMTLNSNQDIIYLHQYGGSGSASAENLYRRKFGIKKAEDIVDIIRKNSMEYNKEKAKLAIE